MKILTDCGYSSTTNTGRSIVHEFKENFAYIAFDFDTEMEAASESSGKEKTYKFP